MSDFDFPLIEAVKQAANVTGFGLGDVAEDVWKEWNNDQDAAQRQAELQAVVQMGADPFREEVQHLVSSSTFIHTSPRGVPRSSGGRCRRRESVPLRPQRREPFPPAPPEDLRCRRRGEG